MEDIARKKFTYDHVSSYKTREKSELQIVIFELSVQVKNVTSPGWMQSPNEGECLYLHWLMKTWLTSVRKREKTVNI